jgi:hypothetical protein
MSLGFIVRRYMQGGPPKKQEKAFCLVHSSNMAIGEHIFSGKQVLAHIKKMEDTLEQRKVYNQSLDHFYTKHMSNFHSNILNHFLHHLPWNNGKDYRYAEICPISRIQRRRDHGRYHKPAPKRNRF